MSDLQVEQYRHLMQRLWNPYGYLKIHLEDSQTVRFSILMDIFIQDSGTVKQKMQTSYVFLQQMKTQIIRQKQNMQPGLMPYRVDSIGQVLM